MTSKFKVIVVQVHKEFMNMLESGDDDFATYSKRFHYFTLVAILSTFLTVLNETLGLVFGVLFIVIPFLIVVKAYIKRWLGGVLVRGGYYDKD